MGTEVTFPCEGGSALGYEAAPPLGQGPGIIVLQEWWGLVHHIRQLCDRLAAQGFVALAPDLYHGQTGKNPDEAGRLMMALNIDRASRDLGGAVRHLLNHPKVSGRKVGIVGFCMGGQLALYASSKYPDIGGCVDFYGIHPNVQPDLGAIRCPVLGFFAEKDDFVKPETARRLEKTLQAHGVKTDFMIYPEVGHAFFNDSRPEAYHRETAQIAWTRMLEFFRRHLASPVPAAS